MPEEKNGRFFEEFAFPTYQDWKQSAEKALKGKPFDKIMYTDTYEGIRLEPIYFKENIEKLAHIENYFPGEFPFVRGGSSAGNKAGWQVAQEIPYPIPEDLNKALKYDLQRGQNAIHISVDRASAIHENFIPDDLSGFDLCISNPRDLESTFDGIDIENIPVFLNAGTAALTMAAMLVDYCKKQGISLEKLKGGIEADPLSELVMDGELPGGLEEQYNEMADLTKWMIENAPEFTTVSINTNVYHNSGAHAVQELGLAIATGAEYLRQMGKMGLEIDQVAPRMRFTFTAGNNIFMEIAKIRAARILWANVVKNFGGTEKSQKMYIHVNTSSRERTKYDPYVNMLRNTGQAFSAIVGGADSVHVGYFDEHFGLPGEFSRRISRNTQLVLAHEAHLTDTIDPAGGSWYIESLTDELSSLSWDYFREIEKGGGISAALESGKIQDEIDEVFKMRSKSLTTRKEVIVGTNKYSNLTEKAPANVIEYNYEALEKYSDDFEEFLKSRDNDKLDKSLDNLESAVKSGAGLFGPVLDCISAGAAAGEIYEALRVKDNPSAKVKPLILRRPTEQFEELRDFAAEYFNEKGEFPRIKLLCYGKLRDYKARADFSADFFRVGGFEYDILNGIENSAQAIKALEQQGPSIVVICSTDENYEEIIPDFGPKFRMEYPDSTLVLAGYPKEKVEEYSELGVDEFIHVKANIYEILKEMQKIAGLR
jgi:methylmalonyl-CoA mutase